MDSRRTVVISGGSQGLGAALALEYVKMGDNVHIVARTESKLQAKVAEFKECIQQKNPKLSPNSEPATAKSSESQEQDTLRQRSHSKRDKDTTQSITYAVADVSDPDQCTRVFSELPAIPDIVICCAGAAQPGFFVDISTEDLKHNLNVVYNTALFFSHAAMKVFVNANDKLQHRRKLVFCSSTVAVFPFIGYGAYAPAKAAIRALADIVRQEGLVHNIGVAHIMPGSMDTEGFQIEEQTKPAVTREIEGSSPPISAEEAAKIVLTALERNEETIFTDTISWILGSTMMGITPRYKTGFLQTLVGLLLVLFGPIVRFFIHKTIRDHKP